MRLLIIGAHPDDAEFHAGGLAHQFRSMDRVVKMISVTDGGAGHHRLQPDELRKVRIAESTAAASVIGATYEVWEFPDGWAEPSLKMREQIIREIRSFLPDLILTHRTCDYHPDHRAVGQAVQDASYMMTVPLVVPEIPIVEKEPVVAYMTDHFTRPNPQRADVVVNIKNSFAIIVEMLMQHHSQFLDFLPFNMGIADQVPEKPADQRAWLEGWYREIVQRRVPHFKKHSKGNHGPTETLSRLDENDLIEVFEISEYARQPSNSEIDELFPGRI